ncbi:MAG: GNAT family N-acetyltransferase [Tissierellia bacterium]|nr:GNAT family N-acetyltransferase [Tissierellia bacterium]
MIDFKISLEELDIEIIKIDEDIINILLEQNPEEFTLRKYNIFKERLAGGTDIRYIGIKNEEILAYIWFTTDEYFESSSGYSSVIDDDTFYIYDVYTMVRHRKKGYMKDMVYKLLKLFKGMYCDTVLLIIDKDNYKSLRTFKFFGFYPVSKIRTLYYSNKKSPQIVELNDSDLIYFESI